MPEFEPEANMISGSEALKAAISTAISARRAADTLDRIENALIVLVELTERRPWWNFWGAR